MQVYDVAYRMPFATHMDVYGKMGGAIAYDDVTGKMSVTDKERMRYDRFYRSVVPKCHWGQRKLLMAELEFLAAVRDSGVDMSKAWVVYVGAAHGAHRPIIYDAFPDVHFILYDGARFLPGASAHPRDRGFVKIFSGTDGWFSDETVGKVAAMVPKGATVLYINDMRLLPEEDDVAKDMVNQFRWGVMMGAQHMMLKFRPPYVGADGTICKSAPRSVSDLRVSKALIAHAPKPVSGGGGGGASFVYASGEVIMQVNAPQYSTETRLVVTRGRDGRYPVQSYDAAEYEERCMFYNERTRIRPVLPNELLVRTVIGVRGWDASFEAARELRILSRTWQTSSVEALVARIANFERLFSKYTHRSLDKCTTHEISKDDRKMSDAERRIFRLTSKQAALRVEASNRVWDSWQRSAPQPMQRAPAMFGEVPELRDAARVHDKVLATMQTAIPKINDTLRMAQGVTPVSVTDAKHGYDGVVRCTRKQKVIGQFFLRGVNPGARILALNETSLAAAARVVLFTSGPDSMEAVLWKYPTAQVTVVLFDFRDTVDVAMVCKDLRTATVHRMGYWDPAGMDRACAAARDDIAGADLIVMDISVVRDHASRFVASLHKMATASGFVHKNLVLMNCPYADTIATSPLVRHYGSVKCYRYMPTSRRVENGILYTDIILGNPSRQPDDAARARGRAVDALRQLLDDQTLKMNLLVRAAAYT